MSGRVVFVSKSYPGSQSDSTIFDDVYPELQKNLASCEVVLLDMVFQEKYSETSPMVNKLFCLLTLIY